jgi:PAS domain S-box-containing protein
MANTEQHPDMSLVLDDLFSGLGGAILESIRTPFGIFGKDLRVLWLNKPLARIHSCRPEEVIGDFCYHAFHGCDRICEACFLEEVRTHGRTVVLEKSHEFPDGKRRWGEIHAYPVRDKERTVAAIIVIIFETTSRIENIARHKQYSALLAEKLNRKTDQQVASDGADRKGDDFSPGELSQREMEVLRLIVDGYTNPQISDMLLISGNTVKRHISNLFIKLDVSDRTQAAVLAVREKIV